MLRLLVAIGMAAMLWPLDENNQALGVSDSMPEIEISSTDVINAAYAIVQDIGSFCERNAETCITGQQAFNSVATGVQSRLNTSVDATTVTGSLPKSDQ